METDIERQQEHLDVSGGQWVGPINARVQVLWENGLGFMTTASVWEVSVERVVQSKHHEQSIEVEI